MPRRHDTLPRPRKIAVLAIDVRPETRDAIRNLAASHGYSMASFLRLVIEDVESDPARHLKKIPKNLKRESEQS
jgi:hypothetical protein